MISNLYATFRSNFVVAYGENAQRLTEKGFGAKKYSSALSRVHFISESIVTSASIGNDAMCQLINTTDTRIHPASAVSIQEAISLNTDDDLSDFLILLDYEVLAY